MKNPFILLFVLLAACANGQVIPQGFLKPHFTCGTPITINHVAGAVAPVTKTVTYGTVTNVPGETAKCWITRNLGASQQPTSVNDNTEDAAGWYWQFNHKQGFKHDGTTRTPATTWIDRIDQDSDWTSVNDPCAIELGTGWRVPTITEWTNVKTTGNWTLPSHAYNSLLKLHEGGFISSNGDFYSRGSDGYYWSSIQWISTYGEIMIFWTNGSNDGIGFQEFGKYAGFSIRCIK